MAGDRYRTPVPKRENEIRASGSGPVIEYKLSPEELARYRAMPAPPPRQVIKRYKEDKPMSVQTAGQMPFTPSKVDFLKQIAAGKKISKLEQEWGMGSGSLHYWISKWNLKGIKPDRAKQLLDEMALDGKPSAPASEPAADPVTTKLEAKAPIGDKDEVARLRAEIDMLREVRAGEKQKYNEEIDRLKEDLNDLQQAYDDAEMRVADAIAERNDLQKRAECDASILEVERTASKPDPRHDVGDPVNHPAHYTAGGIECIDAIHAATTGLTGGQAYDTGAALKYLWRWSRKNGSEDLRKARWHIDHLLGEVEAK